MTTREAIVGPGPPTGRRVDDDPRSRPARRLIVPLTLIAVSYPFWLAQFHASVANPAGGALAPVWLALAFCVPLAGFGFALHLSRPDRALEAEARSARRLAYLVVAAPTLFVFAGVLNSMAKTEVPDAWIWAAVWMSIAAFAALAPDGSNRRARGAIGRWRVAHGVSALILVIFLMFHLANHLAGLAGPDQHKAVMDLGRKVYRSPVVEPILVAAFLFQVATGLRLAWRWSAEKADAYRVFQVASGGYLALFVVGHMNSVFVYARTLSKIDTGWAFAVGAPAGLIHDPWNIRLLPHYWVGVFLVLGHLAAGVRVVLLAHAVPTRVANTLFVSFLAVALGVATAILLGMSGVRI